MPSRRDLVDRRAAAAQCGEYKLACRADHMAVPAAACPPSQQADVPPRQLAEGMLQAGSVATEHRSH